MKSTFIFFYSMLLLSCSKELDCQNFREGTFYMPPLSENGMYYHIIRKSDRQIEIDSNGKEKRFLVNWKNDCSYTLTEFSKANDYLILEKGAPIRPDSITITFFQTIKDTLIFKSQIYFNNQVINVHKSKMIRIGDLSILE